MFNRLSTMRIKAAQEALAAGRWDEAFEIAASPDLSELRAAQRILADLAEPLMRRGQEHLLAQRFEDALADFERCARCGAPSEKVHEWRQRALAARLDDLQHREAGKAAQAEARQRLAQGSLIGAEAALARSPYQDAEAAALSEQISRQRRQAEEAASAARQALREGDLAKAREQFTSAQRWHGKLENLAGLESDLIDAIIQRASLGFAEGRLHVAEEAVVLLGELGRGRSDRIDIAEKLRLAREAAESVSEDRLDRAGVMLGRLAKLAPNIRWIDAAREAVEAMDSQRRAILEGPLGLLARGAQKAAEPVRHEPAQALATMAAPPRAVRADTLPRRLLLRIDGVGSFMLLRGERISIGRAGPGASADLQLISDLSDRHAEIIRAGEDYFLVAQKGVELAGRQTHHALLQSGDRLRLGSRVRMKFSRPSQKSPCAMLELEDGVRTTGDSRKIVLWAGPILLGARRDCHIQVAAVAGGAVLMESGGRLMIKPIGSGEGRQIEVGVPLEWDNVRFSVQAG